MKNLILAGLISVFLTGCFGMTTIDAGHRGIRVVWGKPDPATLGEGLVFYNPFSTSIIEMSVREEKYDIKTDAYTKDQQKVNIVAVATLYPDKDKMHLFYQNLGTNWDDKVVNQAVFGSIKDSVGRIVANDLVANRATATQEIENELKDKMAKRDVTLTKFEITELHFDPAYEQAVEAKVVATQRAQEAVNKTQQVREEAAQKVLAAKAEAESMRIRSEALQKNKNLVEYEYAQAFKEKWDGTLPKVVTGSKSIPVMNFGKLVGGKDDE